MTHTFHIPLDVSGRPARQLTVTHASKKDGLLQCVGLTPTAHPFPSGSYLHTVSMCTFTSGSYWRVLGPLKEKRHKQASLLDVFFPYPRQWLLDPYPVRSVWFEKVQLKTPGVALYKRCFVPQGTATQSTDPCCVNSLLDRRHQQTATS